MADLQLQPSIQTDLRAKAHLALIKRLQDPSFGGELDLSTILVYRIAALVDSAVLAMAWQWDVLNPLLLPVAVTQTQTTTYPSVDVIADIDTLTNIDTLSYLGTVTDTTSLAVAYAQYRALIQLSTKIHSYVGTPQALKDAFSGLGFPNAIILEGQNSWGGTQWPTNEGWAVFRIIINLLTVPSGTDFTTLDQRLRAIANFWKPARCWLDSIQYTMALLDTVIPAPSDSLVNIFSRVDPVIPVPSDFIKAPAWPVKDTKTILSLHNARYYKSNSVTYGSSQPAVAEGPVVVNGTLVEVS